MLTDNADANEDDDHQYMMFSATFSPEIREVADDYLAPDKMVIRIGRVGATHANIHQDIFLIDPPKRKVALYDLLMSRNPMRTVVFTNTTFMAEEVDDFLYSQRLPVTLLHSGLTQREREDAL